MNPIDVRLRNPRTQDTKCIRFSCETRYNDFLLGYDTASEGYYIEDAKKVDSDGIPETSTETGS